MVALIYGLHIDKRKTCRGILETGRSMIMQTLIAIANIGHNIFIVQINHEGNSLVGKGIVRMRNETLWVVK